MKIAIIGAGFSGLSAGYKLSKEGKDVTIFELEDKPGGLANGFRARKWKWPLEQHYHHWFTSDWSIRNLAKEINHKVLFLRPKTSVLVKGRIFQLDSPISLLSFPYLPFIDRLRTGIVLLYLKLTSNWKQFESITAEEFLIKTMGNNAWKVLWKPLFDGKFGDFAKLIPASWFWTRVNKRSTSLGYPVGGFESLSENLAEIISKNGGKLIYNTKVISIIPKSNKIELTLFDGTKIIFDKVICTLPIPLFLKITSNLSKGYVNRLKPLDGLGAVTLILSLKHKFLEDDTYWLNINEDDYPFLSLVEHTNFIDKHYYNDEHLIYIGNYLKPDHEFFELSAVRLLKKFTPALRRINPKFSLNWVNEAFVFKANFAQPVFPLNYSKIIPPFTTPIKGLYMCNIQQVYPWDRGTNYAVELGQKVADMVISES